MADLKVLTSVVLLVLKLVVTSAVRLDEKSVVLKALKWVVM